MDQIAIPTTANYMRTSAELYPQAEAILAPGRIPLTYKRLHDHVLAMARTLNNLGIGRNDRVAIAIPSSAEGGLACLSVEMVATSVPLNPAYSITEFVELMTRLKVKAVILTEGSETAAWQAAEQLDLHIITLIPLLDQEAGLFRLSSSKPDIAPIDPDSERGGFAQPTDIQRLVLTSGTTAASKIIPFTQKSSCSQIFANCQFVNLTPEDRLLCFMPMFHSTGVGYLTQALMSGGGTYVLPGFEVKTFFESLSAYRPTWFPAVTTIFQTIIDQAPQYADMLAEPSLRCILALSMAIDLERSVALEQILKAPVVQVYGATEAGIISGNPLPPRTRKLGSAGVPVYSEVRVIDDNMQPVPSSEMGEIVVRGDSVMDGYEGDPEGTAAAFVDGWYRTGDLGYFDTDGFLFIVGRVKEVINRGGQKVSPGEVEQALLAHPAVAQAVAFATPDPKLGDEVGAAVVLRTGSEVTETELRTFAAERLAPYKIPRRIAFLDNLPKTAIGKPQRLGMAQKLGWTAPAPAPASEFMAPRTDTEKELARLWSEVLGRQPSQISVNARFADLGGSSLNVTQLIFKARTAFNVVVTILDFFDAPTIAAQSTVIEALRRNPQIDHQHTNLIPIQPNGTRPPLFCLHAMHGGVYIYQGLTPFLPDDQPIYGLQAVGMDGLEPPLERIEDMAARQLEEIRAVQAKGPYFLCGYSMGTKSAIEVARRLHQECDEVAHVFCIDGSFYPRQARALGRSSTPVQLLRHKIGTLSYVVFSLPVPYKIVYLRQKLRDVLVWLGLREKQVYAQEELQALLEPQLPPELDKVIYASQRAEAAYQPAPFEWPMTYLHAAGGDLDVDVLRSIYTVARGGLEIIDVPGTHGTIMRDPYMARVGRELAAWLDRLQKQ